ncbi:MAG: flavodoxin family protein [Firmicutes bacterium]|nr:flavodoxin family protein [Bacillota bacterium]
MTILVAYSTKTGNTEKVANAIYEVIKEKATIKKLPDASCENFDTVIMGYWVDRAKANEESIAFLKTLAGKKVVLFGTLGAGDVDDYYKKVCDSVENELPSDCTLLGHQLYRASSIRLAMLRKQHAEDPNDAEVSKQLEDYEANKNRPNAQDLLHAQEFVVDALSE